LKAANGWWRLRSQKTCRATVTPVFWFAFADYALRAGAPARSA